MRKVLFGTEARAKLAEGVEIMFKAVACTLGPKGRNVLMERHPAIPPLLSKDGVTASKEIRDLGDPFLDMACNLLREAASRTSDLAGDGTTTSVVLAHAIFSEGLKHLNDGANPVFLKRGIDKAVAAVVDELKRVAIPITTDEQIIQIGTVSSNGDRSIGELVLAAMRKVGRDGVITLGESADVDTILEFVEGMQIDRGWAPVQPFVTNPERMECVLENPYILLTERKIQSMTKEISGILDEVINAHRPVLIVAGGYDQPFIVTLIHNRNNGIMLSCAVLAPAFGDQRKAILEDMAVVTGGYAFTEDCGRKLDSVEIEDLGQASRITVTRDTTTIAGGFGRPDRIEGRISLLRTLVETAKDDLERERCRQRLARLASGIAIIKVGAQTDVEQREKKDRIEDAVMATKAAVEEGILPGGGKALLNCIPVLGRFADLGIDECKGVRIVASALESPMRQIAMNAGRDADAVVANSLDCLPEYGYDAAKEDYVDLIASGVIDPAKVCRVALQNAASVAAAMLTTEAMVANIPEKKA